MKHIRIGLLALSLAVTAVAHDGMEDVTGTIQKVGDNVVSVKTTKGKMVDIKLAADTEYTRGKAAAKMADLKTGDRVVVHAMEMNGALTAHFVQLPTAAKAKAK
jgi:Cu/Ag efflux protein CusF